MAKNTNNYYNNDTSQNNTQQQYKSDQDIFDIDFDKLYSNFITPVDAIRSHFNALVPNSRELNTTQYQESRCHAFYRMVGFPVVADDGDFYSPGYDPNLNVDSDSLAAYEKIASKVVNNQSLTSQFTYREQQVQTVYNTLFSNGGTNAQAITLGSLFIRSFSQQLGSSAPLEDDSHKEQTIDERNAEVLKIFGVIDFSILVSKHPIKPFIVDPRIDSSIRPIVNRVCAPFLKDKSQTKVFTSTTGSSDSLKRPYIEKVITTRFNNNNLTLSQGNDVITSIFHNITANPSQTDLDLVKAVSDPLNQLYSSELKIFSDYVKIMQVIIEKLIESIDGIQRIRTSVNFQPIPDPKLGVESGTNGGQLNPLNPNDFNNNTQIEIQLIQLTQSKVLNDIQFDTGIGGTADFGDFVFSNLDDSVFSINKNVQKSFDDKITAMTDLRNKSGNDGIDQLRNIEIIMGEFSGIGLIDMVAIQAALWVMDPGSLLGLIDARALGRLIDFRKDINLGGFEENGEPANIPDVISSLQAFESTLLNVYLFIQLYYDTINNGKAFIATST